MALVPFPNQVPDPASADEDDDSEWPGDSGGKMSFLEHLDELRKRIIWSAASIGIGFVIAWVFITPVFDFVMKPLADALPAGSSLVFTEPTESFSLYIQIAALTGLLMASPVIMSQVWLFIAPGLYVHEKRMAIPFVILTSACFVAGAAFSHYVIFPQMWRFFISFTADYVEFMPRIAPAFGLYIKMLLAFGLVFQMPPLVLFLARMGVVTARFLLKSFKYAVFLIFIVSAVITPSGDVFNQTIVALPMIGLYLISILLAWIFGKKRKAEADDLAD
ncbi:MAG: twin-arginine translocase subunit TatC [Acidimicrobiia bacterium]|nr:twin-arginine translocase subunit TatC [Acidimicrobiia bacterium]